MKNALLCGLRGIEIRMPIEAIADCSEPGSADDAVKYWAGKINLDLETDRMIEVLVETGGWTREDLKEENVDTLRERCIWIAACNYREENRLEFK